jgi:hypothetical protein
MLPYTAWACAAGIINTPTIASTAEARISICVFFMDFLPTPTLWNERSGSFFTVPDAARLRASPQS